MEGLLPFVIVGLVMALALVAAFTEWLWLKIDREWIPKLRTRIDGKCHCWCWFGTFGSHLDWCPTLTRS